MKISHELKIKIISNYKGVNIEHYNDIHIAGSIPIKIPSYKEISLSLNLSNDLNLFKECEKWYEIMFDECCLITKIDIGPFMGLFPTEVNMNNNTITFTADEYNPSKADWKDWFIMEESESV